MHNPIKEGKSLLVQWSSLTTAEDPGRNNSLIKPQLIQQFSSANNNNLYNNKYNIM